MCVELKTAVGVATILAPAEALSPEAAASGGTLSLDACVADLPPPSITPTSVPPPFHRLPSPSTTFRPRLPSPSTTFHHLVDAVLLVNRGLTWPYTLTPSPQLRRGSRRLGDVCARRLRQRQAGARRVRHVRHREPLPLALVWPRHHHLAPRRRPPPSTALYRLPPPPIDSRRLPPPSSAFRRLPPPFIR